MSDKVNLAVKHKVSEQFTLDIKTSIAAQGVTAIYGQSGSGKTTLLRCIAGLEKPDKANITIKQETWQNEAIFVPPHKRSMAYVFQESSLLPHLDVKSNLNYAIKRSATSFDASKVIELTSKLGVEHCLNRYSNELSGGERQRVALARALLTKPKLMLMDEPLASLDQARKQGILPCLERVISELKIPIIYVSHSLTEIARLANHVIAIDKGRVISEGNVTEVFSKFDMASFEDDAGVILEGRVSSKDPKWNLTCIELSGGTIWISSGEENNGQIVRIQVLARDVSISLNCHEDTSILNRLKAEIIDIMSNESNSMALLKLRCNDVDFFARVTTKSIHQLNLKTGSSVWAQIKSTAILR